MAVEVLCDKVRCAAVMQQQGIGHDQCKSPRRTHVDGGIRIRPSRSEDMTACMNVSQMLHARPRKRSCCGGSCGVDELPRDAARRGISLPSRVASTISCAVRCGRLLLPPPESVMPLGQTAREHEWGLGTGLWLRWWRNADLVGRGRRLPSVTSFFRMPCCREQF